jgi:hypothetical protein
MTNDFRRWITLCEANTVSEDAWHASPHSFDKFRTNAASGEGGQAYGWGLYFTDSKDVANWYKAQFIRRFGKNNTYKVTIPDANYLHWEAPLAGQSEQVKKAAKSAYNMINGRFVITKQEEQRRDGVKVWFRWQLFKNNVLIRTGYQDTEEAATQEAKSQFPSKTDYMTMNGETFYRGLQAAFARRDGGSATHGGAYQRDASLYLQQKGLQGIKYLNGVGSGHNYVIFNGDDVAIHDVEPHQ